ncbi:sensor histidine kinase [Heyndrickxia acidicola]|uniref:histidine kinase n=1 Tax=Heyndrickxia acidicola TaxID=209389 RepID=A0ABU6MDM6_9BACI|nr:HAMP domain-containing sensor histidine kinase [Heyndrickxia acidicola]MED1202610.1 HAMP domain-containing sensor histidine kinase [Heyndrickxia acidicola]
MKEISSLPDSKIYRTVVVIVIIFMAIGILSSPERNLHAAIMLHLFFVIVVSACLIIYPKRESNSIKGLIVFLIAAYFYTLFFIYPETILNFIFIAILPGIAIVFFHKRIFYTILTFNLLLSAGLFIYAYSFDKKQEYHYLLNDFSGNLLDFYSSQVIIFFIFVMTNARMERLAIYYEQIQKTERFKTTGQLAAAVAHEIRNPITVVKGFLQLYKEDRTLNEGSHRHFHLMLEELQTAEKVINDFLSLAKPAVESSVLCNVGEGINSVVDLLQSYASMNNTAFSISIHEHVNIYCSKVEFNQILVNLIKNAIEAMDHGGMIFITTEREDRELVVSIRDTGMGMESSELKMLGSPFYSLKSKGTGLGLMICYNIIEKYGGSIQFSSLKGEGTTVRLTFQIKTQLS